MVNEEQKAIRVRLAEARYGFEAFYDELRVRGWKVIVERRHSAWIVSALDECDNCLATHVVGFHMSRRFDKAARHLRAELQDDDLLPEWDRGRTA